MMVRHEWRQLKLARLQIDLSLAIERDTDDIQEVKSVAFSHDDTHVVSVSEDQSVRIWDASTGKQVQKLDGHTGSVWSVAFSRDGKAPALLTNPCSSETRRPERSFRRSNGLLQRIARSFIS
jgi:WD40 repeat protein